MFSWLWQFISSVIALLVIFQCLNTFSWWLSPGWAQSEPSEALSGDTEVVICFWVWVFGCVCCFSYSQYHFRACWLQVIIVFVHCPRHSQLSVEHRYTTDNRSWVHVCHWQICPGAVVFCAFLFIGLMMAMSCLFPGPAHLFWVEYLCGPSEQCDLSLSLASSFCPNSDPTPPHHHQSIQILQFPEKPEDWKLYIVGAVVTSKRNEPDSKRVTNQVLSALFWFPSVYYLPQPQFLVSTQKSAIFKTFFST